MEVTTTLGVVRSYPFPWPTPIDPPDWFADLHEKEPVSLVRLPSGDEAYLVSRYRDAQRVWSDPLFSRAAAQAPGAPRYAVGMVSDGSLLSFDPPDHTRLRRLVSAAFTARRIAALRDGIQQTADHLLDQVAARGPGVDLVAEFCAPLPITVICQLLGVPAEDRGTFDKWAQIILAVRSASVEQRQQAGQELNKYFWRLIAAKQDNPTDDLIGDLTRRTADQLTEHEVVKLAQLLLLAGYATTLDQIAITLFALLRRRDHYVALCTDPGKVPAAVEEVLRLHIGGNGTFVRIATEDVEIAGVPIPAGSGVVVNAAAANRDPAIFPHPNDLDLDRPTGNHISFGHGPHFCLGAPLARAELQIAMTSLVERFPTLRLDIAPDDVPWRPGQIVWGPLELPVAW